MSKENWQAVQEDERRQAEAIDERVGKIGSQFRAVEELLTALFERQLDLEAIVKQQQELLAKCYERVESSYAESATFQDPLLEEITVIQQRASVVAEQTVK